MSLLSSLKLSSRLLVPDRLVAPVIITSGLQVHLDAGYSLSYPGSGDIWTDLSGNVRNGTLTNGVTFNAVNRGTLVFDGVNDYVSLDSTLNPSYITIAAWVKVQSGTSGYIISKGYDGVVPYSLSVGGGLAGMAFYDAGWFQSFVTTDIRGDNQWHYVAGMFDGTTLSYYIDAELDASSTAASGLTLPTGTLTAAIGAYQQDGEYMTGNIAAVHIYNRAISEAELLSNYNSTKTRFGL